MTITAKPILALLCAVTSAAANITLDTVPIGNPGNANDSTGYGGVSYTYAIGTYDVTLTQYTAFLNAVAQTDSYNLYNSFMATDGEVAGILRTGSSGNYSYSVIGSGRRPVTYVNWFDAARFTNWLHNGQPTGLGEVAASTEQGAYALNGDTSIGLETKDASAQYWIPNENEWYKAAYYDPALNGGTGGYWLYPTRSNSTPGNVVGSLPNQANFKNTVYSVSQSPTLTGDTNCLTDVGAFTNSASAYGTYDQGGDVNQWNDAVISDSSRGLRGGSWLGLGGEAYLRSSARGSMVPTYEYDFNGFRVATVPEPSVAATLLLCGGSFLARRRRAIA